MRSGSGNDALKGNSADNKLTGGAGNDVLDGRDGSDTAVYSGTMSNYAWLHNSDDSWTVTDLRGTTGSEGTDTLNNIEFLQFSDRTVQISTTTVQLPPPPPPPPPANLAPTAVADSYTTAKGAKLSVSAANGVLSNDTDPEGQALKAVLVSSPGKGNLSLNADGSFVYTPVKNFAGSVTFKYAVSDGTNTSAAASVTITVGASPGTGPGGQAAADAHQDSIVNDQAPAPADILNRPAPPDAVQQFLEAFHVAAARGSNDALDPFHTASSETYQHLDLPHHGGPDGLDSLPGFLKSYEFALF